MHGREVRNAGMQATHSDPLVGVLAVRAVADEQLRDQYGRCGGVRHVDRIERSPCCWFDTAMRHISFRPLLSAGEWSNLE